MQSIPTVACKPPVLQTPGFLKIGLQTPGFPGKTGGSTPGKINYGLSPSWRCRLSQSELFFIWSEESTNKKICGKN